MFCCLSGKADSWFYNLWLASYVVVSVSFSSCLLSWLLPFPCALSVCWWLVSLHSFHIHLLDCWTFLCSILSLRLLSTWCVPLNWVKDQVTRVLRCDRRENILGSLMACFFPLKLFKFFFLVAKVIHSNYRKYSKKRKCYHLDFQR